MVIYSCPAAGCSFSGSLTSIKNHFRLCPKLEVLCPNAGCNAKGPREIMHRDHNPVCQDGFIRCLICSNFVPRRKMEEHKCPVQILRVFGRGEAILAGSRKHFVQCVLLYPQPCFNAADLDKRVIREVLKLSTIWSTRPIPDGYIRIQDYIEQNPSMVGPHINRMNNTVMLASTSDILSEGAITPLSQILLVQEPPQPAMAGSVLQSSSSTLASDVVSNDLLY